MAQSYIHFGFTKPNVIYLTFGVQHFHFRPCNLSIKQLRLPYTNISLKNATNCLQYQQKSYTFVGKYSTTMTHKTYLTILSVAIFCCIFTSCNNKNQNELHQVDVLLEKDSLSSASTLFDKINFSEINTPKDSAYYYLLKTIIMWQQYIPIENDSIINYCIAYYENKHDNKRLAQSYHYKSGIMFCLGKKKEAILLEKKAELLAKRIDDDNLKYYIYNNLCNYNADIRNDSETERCNRKRLALAEKNNNNEWKAYTLENIAALEVARGKIDSATYHIHQVLALIKYVSPEDQYCIWTNMGNCLASKDPKKAEAMYKKALKTTNDLRLYGLLADSYYKQNMGEKAMELWNIALDYPDLGFKIKTLKSQLKYLNEHDREHEAHQVAKRIIALKDSMAIIEQQDSIKEIQNMLEQEYMVQEAREERHMLIAICCGLIVTICIGIAIYTVRRRHYRKEISHHKNEALSNQETLRSLQQSSEQSAKDLKHLHKEMEMLRTEQSQLLAKGKQRYDEIMQGGNTALWHKQDFMAFMEYYRMTEPTFVEQQEKEYNTLSPKLQFFETLSHMGYSNKDIAQILCVGEDSLRSYKARVKKQKR